jgi:beta-galactosidase
MSKLTRFFVILFCLFGWPFCGQAQADQTAVYASLNGDWDFKTDPNQLGEPQQWYQPEALVGGWEPMPVPGNWDLRNEYAHYVGKAWYRRTFAVPSEMKGKIIRLVFEAVYNDSKVWLNGKPLGMNNFGYLPFEFEVTNLLNYNGLNTLAVSADNTFRRGAIWNWGGIRRPVSLRASGPVQLVRQHVAPAVDLAQGTAEVTVKIWLQNHTNEAQNVTGEVRLSNPDGFQKILPFSAKVEGKKPQEIIVKTKLNKKEVRLWHFDQPYLYYSHIKLTNQGQTEENQVRFGLRKIEVDHQRLQFRLNGEPVRLMGYNLVPDDRTTGNTQPWWRIKADVDLLREAGCRLARLTHLPATPELLDYLDERGMLVYQEVPLWGYDQLAQASDPRPLAWMKRLIERDFNHPCIIGWSVGNEIGDVPNINDYVRAAIAETKRLDPTRQAVLITHTAQKGPNDPVQFSDLLTVNKYSPAIGQMADKISRFFPQKLFFYTEFGYGQFTENRDGELNAKGMMDSLRGKPYLFGGSLWTFNDYRSAFFGTKEYSENRPWGIVDVYRQKKRAYATFRHELAPLRGFALARTGEGAASLSLTPRPTLDLPAYPLRNHTLVWQITDAAGKILAGSFKKLPEVPVNGAPWQENWTWAPQAQAQALHVALLTPGHDLVQDTTIYFTPPASPPILYAMGTRPNQNDTSRHNGSLRVVFKKVPHATAYKLRYGKNGLTNQTAPTLNHFVEVNKLTFGDTYQVAVVALNNAGESSASEVKTIQILPEYAPPTVQYVEAGDRGFYVGYATQVDDYMFKLMYTTEPGNYTNAKVLQTTNKGGLLVPQLENGKTYYFKLKKLKHNYYETLASEEFSVTPDGNLAMQNPVIQGVIRQGNEALLRFVPVIKATGYTLEYREKGTSVWQQMEINAAQIQYAKINGLADKKEYEFRMIARK